MRSEFRAWSGAVLPAAESNLALSRSHGERKSLFRRCRSTNWFLPSVELRTHRYTAHTRQLYLLTIKSNLKEHCNSFNNPSIGRFVAVLCPILISYHTSHFKTSWGYSHPLLFLSLTQTSSSVFPEIDV